MLFHISYKVRDVEEFSKMAGNTVKTFEHQEIILIRRAKTWCELSASSIHVKTSLIARLIQSSVLYFGYYFKAQKASLAYIIT